MSDAPPPPAPATSTELAPNLAGALAYVLGLITGILFLVIDQKRPFVRFHAMQSIAVSVALIAVSFALSLLSTLLAVVPVLGWLLAIVAGLGFGILTFLLWLMLMYRAYQGEEWEVPVVGAYARKFAGGTPV